MASSLIPTTAAYWMFGMWWERLSTPYYAAYPAYSAYSAYSDVAAYSDARSRNRFARNTITEIDNFKAKPKWRKKLYRNKIV